jgi:hypothetical protein
MITVCPQSTLHGLSLRLANEWIEDSIVSTPGFNAILERATKGNKRERAASFSGDHSRKKTSRDRLARALEEGNKYMKETNELQLRQIEQDEDRERPIHIQASRSLFKKAPFLESYMDLKMSRDLNRVLKSTFEDDESYTESFLNSSGRAQDELIIDIMSKVGVIMEKSVDGEWKMP